MTCLSTWELLRDAIGDANTALRRHSLKRNEVRMHDERGERLGENSAEKKAGLFGGLVPSAYALG